MTNKATLLLLVLLACLLSSCQSSPDASLRVATFRCDVTPPAGEPLVWDMPLKSVEERLWAKGIVLDARGARYVICAIDWCEVCNDSDLRLRTSLADGAGIASPRVILSSVHQHAAPYADNGAHRLLDNAPNPVLHLSDGFLADVSRRLTEATTEAVLNLQEINYIGTGKAAVERVASARRIKDDTGNIVVRFSGSGKVKELADAPEGPIDPFLRTVTFAHDDTPLVRLHYYATHPQTFCCDGRASSDFVGQAREELEKEEGVFQVYFTGAAGDVTVGKYNDSSAEAADGLKQRLLAAMQKSIRSIEWAPIDGVTWRTADLTLPLRTDPGYAPADARAKANDPRAAIGERVYKGAIRAAFADRIARPLQVSAIGIGGVWLLHLPGEPMLEFQFFAQQTRQDGFVAVAGYADCGPGYICTDAAFREGGYEPTAANSGPGSEARLKTAIRQVLNR